MSFVYQMPDKNLVMTICKGSLMSLLSYLLSFSQFHVFATAVVITCFILGQTAVSQVNLLSVYHTAGSLMNFIYHVK